MLAFVLLQMLEMPVWFMHRKIIFIRSVCEIHYRSNKKHREEECEGEAPVYRVLHDNHSCNKKTEHTHKHKGTGERLLDEVFDHLLVNPSCRAVFKYCRNYPRNIYCSTWSFACALRAWCSFNTFQTQSAASFFNSPESNFPDS